jgi:pectate lyase
LVPNSSYYENIGASGVNTRMGAQVLVESTVFVNAKKAITSLDSDETGSAVANDVDLGGSTNDAPKGTLSGSSLPYKYTLLGSSKVKASVTAGAGQKLSF